MKRGEVLELDIENYAFGGKGIARVEKEGGKYPVFVNNAIPGQRVKAQIKKKRTKFAEANLLEVLERSDLEKVQDFQPVSGAPYITLPIEVQQDLKKESTLAQYRRIGEINDIDALFHEYIASPLDYFYRNKMEYSFSCIRQNLKTGEEEDDAFALGSKTRGTWWKVEDLDKPSGLFDEEIETKLQELRVYLKNTGLKAWHPPRKHGFYRHLVIRKSFSENRLLINLVTSSESLDSFDREGFVNKAVSIFGDRVAGIQHTINDDVADRAKIENGENKLLFGDPVITEEIHGLKFEISMESFFQTNPKSAELLYQRAIDYANLNYDLAGKNIMDLFCGTGTIGQIMAKGIQGAKIVGVDIVPEAIEDAKRNADQNGLENLKFFAADVGKFLREYPEYAGDIHTIMLDPPRAGIAPKTLRKVIALGAEQIVYISCNPATQARDAKELAEGGYSMKKLSLVDQFPHTSHIEAVALFSK